ncbi:hypothetical protein L7F22_008961 [Adiantum nelumboides]|nr:hypothetical protein [Adiantum nelumboides]
MLQAAALVFMLVVLCVSQPAPTEAAGGRPRKTNMRFYLHNVIVGPNATAVAITAPSGNLTSYRFGRAFAMDDVLTRGPLLKSKEVGRAQGFYMWDSVKKQRSNACVLLFFTCTFNGVTRYEGSSIVVQGSIGWDMPFHEVAIVGGTGRFRLAQGYAVVDPVVMTPSYVVLKLNATILH